MSLLNQENINEVSPEWALNWYKDQDFVNIPPYFMTHWKTRKKFFYCNGSLVAFEETLKSFVLAGEPLIAAGFSDDNLRQELEDLAQKRGKKICGYYVGTSWNWKQFQKLPLGTSTCIPVRSYNFKSSYAKEVRRALRKGQENGYLIKNISLEDCPDKHLLKLHKSWKRKKLPFNLKFFLSQPKCKSFVKNFERWYAVEKNGEYLAFCSLLPYKHKACLGMYTDNLIYNPNKEPHALSYLISSLMLMLQKEGVEELNLGLNPFAKIENKRPLGRIFNLLYLAPVFYRPKGLHFFKSKFAGSEKKEYCFYQQNANRWTSLMDMAKVTLFQSKKSFN